MTEIRGELFWADRWTGSSAFGLPLEARGLYREMLTQAWWRGAQLPNNHDVIRRFTGVTLEEWSRCWSLVERYWRVEGETLVNDTQVKIYRETLRCRETRSAAGQAGNEKRWGKRQPIANPIAKPSQTASQNHRKPIAPDPDPDPKPDLTKNKKIKAATHTRTATPLRGVAATEWPDVALRPPDDADDASPDEAPDTAVSPDACEAPSPPDWADAAPKDRATPCTIELDARLDTLPVLGKFKSLAQQRLLGYIVYDQHSGARAFSDRVADLEAALQAAHIPTTPEQCQQTMADVAMQREQRAGTFDVSRDRARRRTG